MALAINDFSGVLKIAYTGTCTAGTPFLSATGAVIAIPQDTIATGTAAGVVNVLTPFPSGCKLVTGVAKSTAAAWVALTPVFYNATAAKFVVTAATTTYQVGYVAAAAAAGDTTGDIILYRDSTGSTAL
jgi:hypothetical protein